MYAYISGILKESTPSEAIIEAHGVGFYLSISLNDFAKLPPIGSFVLLYTAFVVREQSQTLYGFLTKEGKALFEELITISGIGPKTALGIIGHLTYEELEEGVRCHDTSRLVKVPGIGKKTAERLLIELQGKLKLPKAPLPKGHKFDALQALMQLGFTESAAETAVKKAAATLTPEHDLSTLISTALKFR